jgi:DNA-binding winged helix-turn-helix (wHTH) protein
VQVSFGEFIADFDQRRLFARDREIRLTPKCFELLSLLIEHRPRALKKDELFAGLWPDTFVTENTLATLVADLRSALGDDPHEPRFIRTVYVYGYALACDVVERPRPAAT